MKIVRNEEYNVSDMIPLEKGAYIIQTKEKRGKQWEYEVAKLELFTADELINLLAKRITLLEGRVSKLELGLISKETELKLLIINKASGVESKVISLETDLKLHESRGHKK
jgi:hypothetical protein